MKYHTNNLRQYGFCIIKTRERHPLSSLLLLRGIFFLFVFRLTLYITYIFIVVFRVFHIRSSKRNVHNRNIGPFLLFVISFSLAYRTNLLLSEIVIALVVLIAFTACNQIPSETYLLCDLSKT